MRTSRPTWLCLLLSEGSLKVDWALGGWQRSLPFWSPSSVGELCQAYTQYERLYTHLRVLTREPHAGATQLSITVIANAAAAAVGVRDADAEDNLTDEWRGRQPTEGTNGTLARILRHQVSVDTISIGFSGILFALNAIAMQVLSGKSAISMRLDEMPYQLRLLVMQYLPQYIDRRWGSPRLELPARWAPFAQVIASQCSDPVRVSLVGHLAGALAALSMRGGEIDFSWWRRRFPSRRGAADSFDFVPAIYALMRQLPLHLFVWWLGRRAVLQASRRRHDSGASTDWPAALRSIWRDATRRGGPNTPRDGRRGGFTSAPRTWGFGTWGKRDGEEARFVGQVVSVVGLQREKQLNGLEVRLAPSSENCDFISSTIVQA